MAKKHELPDVYSIDPKGCRLRRRKPYDVFKDPEFLKRLPEEMAKNEEKFADRRERLRVISFMTAQDLATIVG